MNFFYSSKIEHFMKSSGQSVNTSMPSNCIIPLEPGTMDGPGKCCRRDGNDDSSSFNSLIHIDGQQLANIASHWYDRIIIIRCCCQVSVSQLWRRRKQRNANCSFVRCSPWFVRWHRWRSSSLAGVTWRRKRSRTYVNLDEPVHQNHSSGVGEVQGQLGAGQAVVRLTPLQGHTTNRRCSATCSASYNIQWVHTKRKKKIQTVLNETQWPGIVFKLQW